MTQSTIRASAFLFFILHGPLLAVTGDADNDGLRDEVETATGVFVSAENTGTRPDLKDTDGDSMPDGMELSVGTNPTSSASKIKRPNIILINCDDLGYGDVGCFWQNQRTGARKFATPSLDEMAAQGAMMTHHYVGAPICAPSRASLMQGRHQGNSEIRDRMFDVALPDNHSIASLLKASGYQTVHIGKAGIAGNPNVGTPPAHPLYRGFNRFIGYLSHFPAAEHYPRNGTTTYRSYIHNNFSKITDAYPDLYTADLWTAFAKKTIIDETASDPNRPFFLYLAYETPHWVSQVPPTREYPAGRGVSGGIQWTGAPSYVNTAVNDSNRVDNVANLHPSVNASWPLLYQKFASSVRRIDDAVADILQTLKDLNIDENTLVVFTSDNGPDSTEIDPQYFQSYAGFEGIKQCIYEGGIRVPTIVRWPGKIPSTNQLSNIRRIDKPSANYDWLATFAELALAPAPSYTDGDSILPDLTGQANLRKRDYLYFEFWTGGLAPNYPDWPNHRNESMNQMQAIRIGDFMGIRTNIASGTENFRIYNVVSDPKQGIDLSQNRPDLQQRMKYLSLAARRPIEAATVPSASRPYDTTPIPSLPPSPMRNGVKWKSYQGFWPWLPEFRDLTPVDTGNGLSIATSILPSNKDVGAAYETYISVPTTGAYTFQLAANANCSLWLHEAHAVDNDYNFSPIKTGKPIYLAAGMHPVRLFYRHQAGTPSLQLNWSGPGFAMQPVPQSALFIDGKPTILNPDSFTLQRSGNVLLDVLADDTAEIPLTLTGAGNPLFGASSVSSGRVSYQPNAEFIGREHFQYEVDDGVAPKRADIDGTVLYENEIWFPLDEGTGILVRQAGGSGTGTIETDDPAVAWVRGNSGRAVRFRGVSDQITLQSTQIPSGSAPRAFSCWMRTSSASPSEGQALFSQGSGGFGKRFTVRLAGLPGTPARQALRLETEGGIYSGTIRVNDGLWHHVAVSVMDGNSDGLITMDEARIHIDGVQESGHVEALGIVLTSATESPPTLGGAAHDPNFNFNGDLDDVRFFPRAIDTADAQFLYSNPPKSAEYGQTAVVISDDYDGDSFPNDAESIAGTDPFDPGSYPRIKSMTSDSNGFQLKWVGIAGRTYRVLESADLKTWSPAIGVPPVTVTLSSSNTSANVPFNGLPNRFFTLQINETQPDETQSTGILPPPELPAGDQDGDGISNIDELISGTDPILASSALVLRAERTADGTIKATWDAVAGRTYRLLQSTDLNSWGPIPDIDPIVLDIDTSGVQRTIPANYWPNRFIRLGVSITR